MNGKLAAGVSGAVLGSGILVSLVWNKLIPWMIAGGEWPRVGMDEAAAIAMVVMLVVGWLGADRAPKAQEPPAKQDVTT